MKKFVFLMIVFLLVCCTIAAILADYYRESPEVVTSSFVGRDSCASCHQPQSESFQGSHHDKAMAIATDESVLADFNNQTLKHFGVTSTMFRDNNRFMINTEGPDGQMHDYEVKYTFGVEPLQQYMVEIQPPTDSTTEKTKDITTNKIGRVQVLRVSWDTERKKWFYLSPPDVSEKLDPTDPLHWTGTTQNWNTTCAICHSTDFHKNFDLATNSYHSTFSEIDVSCEACHGPASYHVELAERTSLFWDRKHGYGLAKLKTESNLAQINTCAPCHSRRAEVEEGFSPGCNFDEYFVLQTISEPIYFADGQIRDEDYVHGSFIQSKMFHNGVKCSDCHDMHSTKLIHSGNQVCTSCHQHPAGKYDSPNHHHHTVGTPGAQCVNCHMPSTTYMDVDHRRDHSFRVPDPALSIATGTPNACTACHLQDAKLADHKSKFPLRQYKDWIEAEKLGDEVVAAELSRINDRMLLAIDSWYGDEDKERTTYYRDLAEALAASMDDDEAFEKAQTELLALAKDTRNPAMIRASALEGIIDPGVLAMANEAAVDLLKGDDLKIVAASLSLLDRQRRAVMATPAPNRAALMQSLELVVPPVLKQLGHPASRIRIQAARILVNLQRDMLEEFADGSQRKQLRNAMLESQTSLMLNSDQAMSHAMKGGINQLIGDFSQAEKDYRNAIRVGPNTPGPRTNLALLLDSKQRSMQTPAARNKVIEEVKRLRREEHELLRIDVERAKNLPDTHALHYGYAMSSFVQGDYDETEKHLAIALEQQPENERYLQAMALFLERIKEYKQADQMMDRLLKIDPENAVYQKMKDNALRNLKRE